MTDEPSCQPGPAADGADESGVPDDRLRRLGRMPEAAGTDLTGIELRASDVDWALGSGTTVTSDAQDLALFLTGRRPGP